MNTGVVTTVFLILHFYPDTCKGRLISIRALFGIAQTALLVTSYVRNRLFINPMEGELVNLKTMRISYIILFIMEYVLNIGTVYWDEDHPYIQSCKGLEVKLKIEFEEDPMNFVLRLAFIVVRTLVLFLVVIIDAFTVYKIILKNKIMKERYESERVRSYTLPLVTAIIAPLSVIMAFIVSKLLWNQELIDITHIDRIANVACIFHVSLILAVMVWGSWIAQLIQNWKNQRRRARRTRMARQLIEGNQNNQRLRPMNENLIELHEIPRQNDPEPLPNQIQAAPASEEKTDQQEYQLEQHEISRCLQKPESNQVEVVVQIHRHSVNQNWKNQRRRARRGRRSRRLIEGNQNNQCLRPMNENLIEQQDYQLEQHEISRCPQEPESNQNQVVVQIHHHSENPIAKIKNNVSVIRANSI